MSIWHSTEAVCLILGLICIFYYIGIVGYAGITADFAWIWLVGAAFLLAIAGGMVAESRHHMAVLANLLRAAGILIAIGILVVGFIGAHIFAGMRQKPEQNLPYVIVLGAQVRGTKVSKHSGSGWTVRQSMRKKIRIRYFFCRAVRETARISQRQKRCRSI